MGKLKDVPGTFNLEFDSNPLNLFYILKYDQGSESYDVPALDKKITQRDLIRLMNGGCHVVNFNLKSNGTTLPVIEWIFSTLPETSTTAVNRAGAGNYFIQNDEVQFLTEKCSLPSYGENGSAIIPISDVNVTEISYFMQVYTQAPEANLYVEFYRAADNVRVDINEVFGNTGGVNISFLIAP